MSLLTIPQLAKSLSLSTDALRDKLKINGYIQLNNEGKWELTDEGIKAGGVHFNFYGRKIKVPEDIDLSFAREFDSNFTLRMADFDKIDAA